MNVGHQGAAHPLRSYHPFADLGRLKPMRDTTIPLEAAMFHALERRQVLEVGERCFVRNPDTRVIEEMQVIGIVMLMTEVAQFRLHYVVGHVAGLRYSARYVGRRTVPWHFVFRQFDEAVALADQYTPTWDDSVDLDINAAVAYHRQQLRNK